jgi:hypothetical protein
MEGNISSFDINSSGIINISYEFYNTGSIPYAGRLRADITSNNKTFSLWTPKNIYMPGTRKHYELFWYGLPGNYSLQTKAYVGNEIIELDKKGFQINDAKAEDVFQAEARTYDNFIALDITSKANTTNIYVMPNSPTGWIFEQGKIKSLSDKQKKTVKIPYEASVFYPISVNIIIASDDGTYASVRGVDLKKDEGIASFFGYIIDTIKVSM